MEYVRGWEMNKKEIVARMKSLIKELPDFSDKDADRKVELVELVDELIVVLNDDIVGVRNLC